MTRDKTIDIGTEDFKAIGYQLVDRIADFIDSIDQNPVTSGDSVQELRALLGNPGLPEEGMPAAEIISRATELLAGHSLFNGHPKFMGYITSSPAPIGMFGDFIAAAINANVGAHILSPMATEIERQTIKWLASFIGVSENYGGILVSGGNMANFTAFLAARTVKAPQRLKEAGLNSVSKKLIIYCSKTTHTWVEKAAILFGHGSESIRWIPTTPSLQMDHQLLEEAILKDLKEGHQPFMVIGTAGDVSTGVVDDLKGLSAFCKAQDLWFHIDGAYGVPAAVIPELKLLFDGVQEADSIALDPHKWLYSPLEAGCTLVKNPRHLVDTYSSHPDYYNFSSDEVEPAQNFYEYGLQNSRGFRALKVWMALQQVGKKGYIKMIREDIELAAYFFELATKHPELEAITHHLSITTLRYVPFDCPDNGMDKKAYLDNLNEALLNTLQKGGELFLSHAIVGNRYCLRACIVNFRTSKKDIAEVVEIIVREGNKLHQKLR